MPVHRKRFRIEEIYNGGTPIIAGDDDAASMPMHREIMAELRAIRERIDPVGKLLGARIR